MTFPQFRELIKEHLDEMQENATHLFEVAVDKDELWELYMNSYPASESYLYKERRVHDCSACRHFIRSMGNVVSIKDNIVSSIWDVTTGETDFQSVADAMSRFVKSHAVNNVFISPFKKQGIKENHAQAEDGTVLSFYHFYTVLPKKFVARNSGTVDSEKAVYRDSKAVFQRSLSEITQGSIEVVLELIASNTLYKGNEWEGLLQTFLQHKKAFDKLTTDEEKNLYAWEKSVNAGGALTRIRNHAIGVLLSNISEGMDLDKAVTQYEAIVAPSNYKRPKAIFTQKMLDDAKAELTEMGYLDSLSRRYATLDDITVNNILFSNKDSAKRIAGAEDIFASLSKAVVNDAKKFSKLEEISAEKFIKDVLPTVTELEVYFENKHANNMMSLIAPAVADSKTMFKWNNNFS